MQVVGQIEEYFFTYRNGFNPECFIKIKDIINGEYFLIIIENKPIGNSEKFNQFYNENNYYSFIGAREIIDTELISTIPYSIQEDYRDVDVFMIAELWTLEKDIEIFLF